MAENNTPIQSRYAQQYAADLNANREEQAELRGRLEQLQSDEKWLVVQLQNAPVAEEIGAPAEAEAPQAVPGPRQELAPAAAAPSGAKKRVARTKASAKGAAAPKKKASVTKAPAKKAAKAVTEAPKSVEPPLHEVVLGLLRAQPGHPHLAREVHTELADKHGRSTSIQVVRNSLESLVKKGSIEKENKQNSVMYTAPAAAESAAEKASEKVPADA
ncbi:BlaI/MecI/CopY family transcriptional regulator [Streptomyces agglomeratus]|uniref:BlaI/MecI/CopY family transcriptional regulator n=1 Tax=Streptomyces agglomeratus TaxID=285458 RepID=UPI0009A05C93|nr:BlaI/MecI/CopY family transcriptional regulator [Streptomyces agglomeratus]